MAEVGRLALWPHPACNNDIAHNFILPGAWRLKIWLSMRRFDQALSFA